MWVVEISDKKGQFAPLLSLAAYHPWLGSDVTLGRRFNGDR